MSVIKINPTCTMYKLLSALFLLMALNVTSQTSNNCDSSKWAKEGTYEIIQLSKVKELLTTDVLCLIESNRRVSEYNEIQLSPYTKIKIYPKTLIEKKSSDK
jgi:hypothetical protein